MSLMERGKAALIRRMQAGASPDAVTITYRRLSGGPDIDLTGLAWRGRKIDRRDGRDGGLSVEYGERDYLIPAAELPASPEAGDRIVEADEAGAQKTYEVLPVLGEPAWRWAESDEATYRVHVKKVEP